MRILTIVGTRPEAVKLAPVIKELEHQNGKVESVVCSTGQHREMLEQMFTLFNIHPDLNLNVMRANQSPLQVAARVMEELDPVLAEVRPDWVLLQGDTTTVMAASIAAHYHRIRVAHVEAGLRTYDRMNPFPEEMNRVVADHVSDWHFAPTKLAKDNLLREGIRESSIFVTGNTVVDALLEVVDDLQRAETERTPDGEKRHRLLVTAHRRENHGRPLQHICDALIALARRNDVEIIYLVHRNPNVWNPVHERLSNVPNIVLCSPQDYLETVRLMQTSTLILTDSGGIQEEAPTLNVPVLVLRETTERPEAVEAGVARVVGTSCESIVREATRLLESEEARMAMAGAKNPYGDGKSANRIVSLLLNDGHLPAHLQEWTI